MRKNKGFMITDPVKIEKIVMNVVSPNPQSSLSSNEVGKQSLKAFAGQIKYISNCLTPGVARKRFLVKIMNHVHHLQWQI
ncbi:hypothetical protein YC2023_106621 [Brassica napus]